MNSDFLQEVTSRGTWPLGDTKSQLKPERYWLGKGDYALEVILASAASRPSTPNIREVWKDYQGNRPAPVLLVVTYPSGDRQVASACGPVGQNPAVWEGMPVGQVERLAKSALEAFDRNQASNLIQQALPELHSPLPGVTNRGLFSTHDLVNGVPDRPDWKNAVQLSLPLLERKGNDLVQALGFDIQTLTPSASILRAAGARRAVAVFLQEHELPEVTSERFNRHSPITYALTMADQEGLPYAVVTRGSQIRLYCADVARGVGRKGRTDTYVELNLSLIGEDIAGLLTLLFAPGALEPGGTVDQLLEDSHRFATDIGERLRDRIYLQAVPSLATSLARKQSTADSHPTSEQMDFYYEQAMLVLFRILFVAYAEDRDLLPYRTNGDYKDHSLKHRAERLASRVQDSDDGENNFASNQSNLWDEVSALWKAVDKGNTEWGVPPYNGGLFDDDPNIRPAGAALAAISLTNAEFGPALKAMLIDEAEDGVYGPVDFRSLSVREFGTIYEGLLESSLGFAETDLAVDKKGSYIPATDGQNIAVHRSEFYLHNRSGKRKSTGSYFTKSFAVEHLLDHALIPALTEHLERINELLESGDEASAAEMFFDFRCADISMGSGHFLIAAIDHIEREMANFLNRNPIMGVQKELDALRNAALGNLKESTGVVAELIEIENSNLLRRQIARRCIYGVDLNPIAVELARLSVWIHTFVPGLPLSLLDRTLIHGDSLTGIGTREELLGVFDSLPLPLLNTGFHSALIAAAEPLKRLAKISEATIREAGKVREEYELAVGEAAPLKDLMDLAVGVRLGVADKPAWIDIGRIDEAVGLDQAKLLADELNIVHFPAAFPEVFVTDRQGFDCIVGNPPWEKVKVEQDEFWGRHFQGHRSLSASERRSRVETYRRDRPDLVKLLNTEQSRIEKSRNIIKAGPFDLGSGDTDLYKVFSWRFWQLVKDDGYVGVVLPRSALSAAGMIGWRKKVITHGRFTDTTILKNLRNWVFDDVSGQYTIVLAVIKKSESSDRVLSTRGPYNSLTNYKADLSNPSPEFPISQFKQWSEDLIFPLIPSAQAGRIYQKVKRYPRFAESSTSKAFRPVREFETSEISRIAKSASSWVTPDLKKSDVYVPIYGGQAFNVWQPDSGKYYGLARQTQLTEFLFEKRNRQSTHQRSAFYDLDSVACNDVTTLPLLNPRIAVRDVARSTDSRTLIACLVPPNVTLTEKAPYLYSRDATAFSTALLLGLLCSIPLDWITRRTVELKLSFGIITSLPIPEYDAEDSIAEQLAMNSARLASVDNRYEHWAKEVGVEVGSVRSEDEKQDIIHRIDALAAHLYGLEEEDLRVIFETFHVGWDYEPRLNAVLSHFRSL